MFGGDGDNKNAPAIDSPTRELYDKLFHLAGPLQSSDITFNVPEKGFDSLASLLTEIFQAITEAEEKAASDEQDAGATKKVLERAEELASLRIKSVISPLLRGLPIEASPGLDSSTPITLVGRYEEEVEQWKNFCQVLFNDKELQLKKPLYLHLSALGQRALAQAASTYWDTLLGRLRHIENPEFPSSPDTLLAEIQSRNRDLKALLREYVLASAPFKDPEILARVEKSHAAEELGLGDDARLRIRNLEKRPNLFKGEGEGGSSGASECSVCCAEEDVEIRSGKVDQQANDDFLTFPGTFDGKKIRPLIDTGGGCNLVKAEWLRKNNIKIVEPLKSYKTLLMADGTESQKCPCLEVKWRFDGRKTEWRDVEFVVVEGYKYEALIGLPFLKHTETIHNSAGRLVFPEFKGVHANKDTIPLYEFGVTPCI